MALIMCPECSRQVSSLATSCPGCGRPLGAALAPSPHVTSSAPPHVPKKKTSVLGVGFLLVVLVGVLASAIEKAQVGDVERPTTAAKREKTEQEKAQDNVDFSTLIGVNAIRKASRNPEAFQLDQALAMYSTNAGCIEARAQNGFGGMNRIQAVVLTTPEFKIVTSEEPGFSRAWGNACAGVTGQDITSYAKQRLR